MSSSRTITDARGQPTTVYPIQDHWQSPTLPAPVFADLRARFIDTGFLGLGLPAWMLWLLIGLHAALLAALFLLPSPALLTVLSAALIATYIAYWLTYKGQLPTPDPEALVEALLQHHLCPSCTYNLGALPPHPSGHTTCPECGATWTLPPRIQV